MPVRFLYIAVWLSEATSRQKRRVAAQGLVEYALLTLFVALLLIGILTLVGSTLCTQWYLKLLNGPFGPGLPTCQE